MDENWVEIFRSTSEIEVAMLKSKLEANEVQAMILNQKDSFYQIGDVILYVLRDTVIRAKQTISQS